MASMFRWHQLTGPNNKRITWQPGNAGQYYFMDAPIKTQICGKKFVSALSGVMVTYTLTLNNSAGNDLVVTRDDINQALLSQIQVDGTTLGTLISAAHMKPGIIDTNDFISSGGTMMANAYNDVTIPSLSIITIKHQVWIPLAYYGCESPCAMAPMTSWIRPANLTLFSPTVYPSNFGSNITISNASYLASARMLWRDEIIVPPGAQMTRFKSTATVGGGSDTVDLKSFGKNSTLQGVEQRAAIAACLWASSLLSGDGSGAGLVEGITDMSALFAGIEQTNDISPFIEELRMNYAREAPDTLEQFAVAGQYAPISTRYRYPLFCLEQGYTPFTAPGARFLPIFAPIRRCHISKMPIADGSPSFQLTGTFTNPDHYSYLWALYQWQTQQSAAMIEKLAEDDIGKFLYGDNNLAPVVKLHKKNPHPIDPEKSAFLPSKLLPASQVAAMGGLS